MNEYLAGLVSTRGWEEAEKVFNQKVEELINEEIDPSLASAEYKIVHMANLKAANTVKASLNRIKSLASIAEVGKKTKFV
jgi:hypothetical protein|tara:strand:+ start:1115 stop:1354 length:240 start_codon:yes stop_codon:yes gene_type:complete